MAEAGPREDMRGVVEISGHVGHVFRVVGEWWWLPVPHWVYEETHQSLGLT